MIEGMFPAGRMDPVGVAPAEVVRLAARCELLEAFVAGALMASLLDIRRAAFAPEIGVRYTEAIRADIANACFRLEDGCREALDAALVAAGATGKAGT